VIVNNEKSSVSTEKRRHVVAG